MLKMMPVKWKKNYLKIKPWFPWVFHVTAKPVTCSNCKAEADVYCVDCKACFCKFCAVLLHHPDTKFEKHSLEDIVKPEDGVMPEVKIISPILLDLVLITAAYVLFRDSERISAEYYAGTSYCPGLSRIRWWLVWADANVFFYVKNDLAQYCDWEDSYWRFFKDAWVRGILTNTDSLVLLLVSFAKAATFEKFMEIFVVRLAAYVYAVLAYLVRSIEFCMHKILYERLEDSDHTVTKILQWVSRVVQSMQFSQKLGITDTSVKLAPPTHRRKRPAEDWGEYLVYMMDRRFRLLAFHKAQAQSACSALLKWSLMVTLLLRVFCLRFGQALLEAAEYLGMGSEQHQRWFTQVTGTGINESGAYYYWSDRLLSKVFPQAVSQVLMQIPLLAELVAFMSEVPRRDLGETASWLMQTALRAIPLLMRLWYIWLFLLLRVGWNWHCASQQTAFAKKWKEEYKKEIWGKMSRKNPFGATDHIDYTKLNFSPVPEAAPNGSKGLRRQPTMTA